MGKGVLFLGLLIVVAIAAIAGLLYRPATLIGASDKSLAYSIRKEADSNEASCRGDDPDFTCVVFASGSPARSGYSVNVDDYGCWEARSSGGGEAAGAGIARRLSGCITVVDLIRLDD